MKAQRDTHFSESRAGDVPPSNVGARGPRAQAWELRRNRQPNRSWPVMLGARGSAALVTGGGLGPLSTAVHGGYVELFHQRWRANSGNWATRVGVPCVPWLDLEVG